MRQTGALRLKAADAEDLVILASCLQDSVVPVRDISYSPEKGRFYLLANRFRWEEVCGRSDSSKFYARVHSGVFFDNVKSVRYRDFDRDRVGSLCLLTMQAGDGYIDLIFAHRGVIRLEVDGILCHLDDMDEPWMTRLKPRHPGGEEH